MSKLKLRIQAQQLRKNGESINIIAKTLNVSSSTVSLWCKDVVLTSKQLEKLRQNSRNPFYGKRAAYLEKIKSNKINTILELKDKGIKEVGVLTSREYLIAGIALYWAEGFKKDNRLGFANSDPLMIKFVLDWLIKICKVPKADIILRVGINISHKYRANEILEYWSKVTSIPTSQFKNPYFQQVSWKKEFPKPEEYFGVLRIRANKQLKLFRNILGWIEGLKLNKAG